MDRTHLGKVQFNSAVAQNSGVKNGGAERAENVVLTPCAIWVAISPYNKETTAWQEGPRPPHFSTSQGECAS